MVALRLKLDNVTNLPDGGPISLDVEGRRSIDIGRNTYLDWTLPDPARVVSGRHCEIHYRDGGYWLTDISTNGTYLNGSDKRLTEPTRLRTGDRIAIGDYLINVVVEDEDGPARTVEAPPHGPAAAASGALWDVPDDRAAPADRTPASKAAARPVHADVLDWISDLPTPETPRDAAHAGSADPWSADAPHAPAPVEPAADAPAPQASEAAPRPRDADSAAEDDASRTAEVAPAEGIGLTTANSEDDVSQSASDTPADAAEPQPQAADTPRRPVDDTPDAAPADGAAELPPWATEDDGDAEADAWRTASEDDSAFVGAAHEIEPAPAHSPSVDDPDTAEGEVPRLVEPEDGTDAPVFAATHAPTEDAPRADEPEVEDAPIEAAPAPTDPSRVAVPTAEEEDGEPWQASVAPEDAADIRAAEAAPHAAAAPADEALWRAQPAATDAPAPTAAPQEAGFGPAVRAGEQRAQTQHGPEFERFVVALAAALDVPRDRLDVRSPEELAQRVGAYINLSIGGLQRLLKARATSRGVMRAGPGTQVQAAGNNPLKFMPTPGAAADVFFGPPSRAYLGIEETLDESFADLGTHQMALLSAMQGAVTRMLADLDPAAIERGDGEEKGFALPGSRKSKHWDTYKERYTARASQHDNGMVDVFMICFADAYARAIDNRE